MTAAVVVGVVALVASAVVLTVCVAYLARDTWRNWP